MRILNNYWHMGNPTSLQLLNLKPISKSSLSHKIVWGRNSKTEEEKLSLRLKYMGSGKTFAALHVSLLNYANPTARPWVQTKQEQPSGLKCNQLLQFSRLLRNRIKGLHMLNMNKASKKSCYSMYEAGLISMYEKTAMNFCTWSILLFPYPLMIYPWDLS